MVHKTLKLCSSFSNITTKLDKLTIVFMRNGYPPDEVNKFMKNFFDKWYLNDNSNIESKRQTNENKLNYHYISPYYGVSFSRS